MHPREELAHEPSGEAAWFECFDLEYAAADAALGGHVTLLRWPNLGRAWYWASLVEEGAPTITLLETEIVPGPALELRASGIWADTVCERPFEHWSYGLEAFALRLDHPDDALGAFRGERVPFGFELEWEAASPPRSTAGGYGQDGRAHGVLLLGHRQLELDGCGRRGHVWGARMPPIRPGGRFCGPSGWADDAPDRVTGAAAAHLPAPVDLVVHRLLGRSASGGAGWVNLLQCPAP